MSTSEEDRQLFGRVVKALKRLKIVAQKIGSRAKSLDQEWTKPRPIDRKRTGAGRQLSVAYPQTEISVVIALLTSV